MKIKDKTELQFFKKLPGDLNKLLRWIVEAHVFRKWLLLYIHACGHNRHCKIKRKKAYSVGLMYRASASCEHDDGNE